jgi:hypothetical protein
MDTAGHQTILRSIHGNSYTGHVSEDEQEELEKDEDEEEEEIQLFFMMDNISKKS